jgi:hypothetical protein
LIFCDQPSQSLEVLLAPFVWCILAPPTVTLVTLNVYHKLGKNRRISHFENSRETRMMQVAQRDIIDDGQYDSLMFL